MSDQTRWRIPEVISENHAKRYENETKKLFERWLEKCPINYDAIPETSDDNILTINFHIIERRK